MTRRLHRQALDILLERYPATPEQEDSIRRAFEAGRLTLESDGKKFDELTEREREFLLEENPSLYLLMASPVRGRMATGQRMREHVITASKRGA